MDRSPGFGSTPKDYVAQLRLGFPTPPLKRLSLPLKVSRWPIIQKVRRHPPKRAPTACMHIISGSISLPSPGFFSPFPHGTSSLSVDDEYLALEDGPPIFKQNYTCSALLVVNLVSRIAFHVRDYHPLWSAFPNGSVKHRAIINRLFQFRSPLLSESRLISFPRAT